MVDGQKTFYLLCMKEQTIMDLINMFDFIFVTCK